MEPAEPSPRDKLRLACGMHDLGVAIMRQNLKRRHPAASEAELDRLLDEWLTDRPGAVHGDAPGRTRES